MDLRPALSFSNSLSVEEHKNEREYREDIDKTCDWK